MVFILDFLKYVNKKICSTTERLTLTLLRNEGDRKYHI